MNRLIFANQLRGIAALCVSVSHLLGVFWLMPDVLVSVTMAPAQAGPPPSHLLWLVSRVWFELGPFGVGVFFLISGFVIPFSLERHSRLGFLIARVLRIYPTYVVALLLEVAVLYAAARYWHRPFGYDAWEVGMNALLIHNYVGAPSIDLVNWTLGTELKFYLLMALAASLVRRGSLGALFAMSGGLLLGTLACERWGFPNAAAQTFTYDATYLVFMQVGVVFNYRLRGRLSLPAALAAMLWLLVAFIVTWQHSAIASQVPVVAVNYLYAFALFGTLFALRRFARPVAPLDGLAAISFPFYLVHSMLGYSVLKVLMISGHVGYVPAVVAAYAVAILAATVLHRTIERPTQELGKRLTTRRPVTAPITSLAVAASE